MPEQLIPVVCAVITDTVGRILAAKRSASMPLPGKWEFPGGKVHPGEIPEHALVREIREELGVEIEVGAILMEVAWPPIRLLPFRAGILLGQPNPAEHEEIRWVLPAELVSLDWAEADLPIVEELSRA
jgi:8-oxo-dGTP diphosphatase